MTDYWRIENIFSGGTDAMSNEARDMGGTRIYLTDDMLEAFWRLPAEQALDYILRVSRADQQPQPRRETQIALKE